LPDCPFDDAIFAGFESSSLLFPNFGVNTDSFNIAKKCSVGNPIK
jgi:hypothetical protein